MALKRIVPLSAATLLLLGLAIAPALALLPNAQQAPDFQLNDLSNNVHTLSNYRGKVVVIDFFGAYCSYCKDDAKTNLVPLFNDNYKSDAKVQFLSVETSGADAATITSSYLQGLSIPWLVLTGGTGLVKAYDFTSVPTLYVIDPAGNVALTMQYPTNTQTLKATIDKLEASAPTPTPTPTATPTVTPTPSPTITPTPTVTPKPIEKTPIVTPTVEKPTVTPTPAPTAMPSMKPTVKQSESPTASTSSPTPSPTPESDRSNNTQPAASHQPSAKPEPTPQVPPEPQSNATKPQPSAPNAAVKSTEQSTISPTPTPQAVTPQTTSNVSPVRPSAQSVGSDDFDESQNSTATPILPPADDPAGSKSTEQLTSVDSTSAPDTSQGTSLDTTPRVSVATDASNTTASTAAAPTEHASVQANSMASLPPQPVLEFSMLGLGLPAIVVGAVYLMMRRL